ncbi:hypothetical protein C6P40_002792 [Pichia californica]|uniref:Uncharacterized protein n=1 Tax=Pichia californica TaxID=460514 RepID=A0A9P6WJZ7_9ASCO|nr:hypothetical protein C6P42_003172 [[Candida] californica]KAG0687158.1 hypothetical protein C6P40_002792 [[Candida] californica]
MVVFVSDANDNDDDSDNDGKGGVKKSNNRDVQFQFKFQKLEINNLNQNNPDQSVSALSMGLSHISVDSRRRRSSVLRRMSVGSQLDPITTNNSVNKVKIDFEKSLLEDENNILPEDESYDEEERNKSDDNEQDSDTELYKRSNSKTPACKISDFEPLKVLGQGAYGKVLLVKNKKTGKLFAQKELKKASIIVNNKNVERTISERTILSQITSHQNIVKLFYALHDNSKLYLLMEYIPGGELFKYLIQEKFLNEKKTCFYIIQMSTALKFLHDYGIVYRDLKPENCMLDKDGYLILTDFGLAKKSSQDINNEDKIDDNNWCTSIIGTPEYCAPEVLKSENYGSMADWWSLGCVTFDLLTGDPPFTGKNHKTIINKVLKEKPKYPFYVTTESKELLNKLLNKNPTKRFNVDLEWEKYQKLSFFRHYKFKDIENRKIEPPIIPYITDLEKAENFDSEFTNMKLSDLNINGVNIEIPNITNDNSDCFNGFSYTASNSFVDNYL